jgi:hypothetical protein
MPLEVTPNAILIPSSEVISDNMADPRNFNTGAIRLAVILGS